MEKVIEKLVELIVENSGAVITGLSSFLAAIAVWLFKIGYNRYQNRKAAKDLKPEFDFSTIKEHRKIFIPTRYARISPNRYDNPDEAHKHNKSAQLIPFLMKQAFNETIESEKYYLILADSGMGKTAFMVNLYMAYHSFFNFRKRHKMKLFRFQSPDLRNPVDVLDRIKAEMPKHRVNLNDFYINKYPVTLAEFKAYIEASGNKTDADINDSSWILIGKEWKDKKGVNYLCDVKGNKRPETEYDHPVIHVSWNDAVRFCNYLNTRSGLKPVYDEKGNLVDATGNITTDITQVHGFRLPTEAEWEYAAKGGEKSKGFQYAGSDNPKEVAWTRENSKGVTHKVGALQPNELGLYDMSGNVWEWCFDRYEAYKSKEETNPIGSISGSDRVCRGGSWGHNAVSCRVASRNIGSPDYRYDYSGFRLVFVPQSSG